MAPVLTGMRTERACALAWGAGDFQSATDGLGALPHGRQAEVGPYAIGGASGAAQVKARPIVLHHCFERFRCLRKSHTDAARRCVFAHVRQSD